MAAVRTLTLNFRKYRSWRPLKYPFDSELDLNIHNPLDLENMLVIHTQNRVDKQQVLMHSVDVVCQVRRILSIGIGYPIL